MRERENYSVAIYCRLSKDDLVQNIESSSISTQKSMIMKYVRDHSWFVYDLYIDDGWSGTNFDRPDFQRMIEDIELGNVNMVVVKDLSRLGRNYILTGQYTDIVFPNYGVRFIAIDDGVDTLKNNNDITPFKNILNEMYSKDISKKIRSAVRTKKRNGDFLSNYAPYGYKKAPDNKNRLIVEETAAKVVKQIFSMYEAGLGSTAIAKILTKNKELPPLEYRQAQLGKSYNPQKPWDANSVL
ncbi:MAG: recombinase family protein, partial [Clostridia bacterium]|nr:recombinase family protein [Clostridia bacterium]